MSHITRVIHRVVCDRCGDAVEFPGDIEEADAIILPDGWHEVTARVWKNGKPDATVGNERRFADLCPLCVGIRFREL